MYLTYLINPLWKMTNATQKPRLNIMKFISLSDLSVSDKAPKGWVHNNKKNTKRTLCNSTTEHIPCGQPEGRSLIGWPRSRDKIVLR